MGPLDTLCAILVAILWGGNFVAAKIALAHFPPVFLTLLRFVLTAALLVPFVKRPPREHMKRIFYIATISTLHFSLPYAGLAMGLNIASTAITAQLGVPFSCLIGALLLKDHLGPWRISGMLIAFAGMLVVFGTPNVLDHQLAFFITLVGAFFWGLANVAMKSTNHINLLQMLAWMSLFMVPQLAFLSLIFEPGAWTTLHDIPLTPALGLAYTVFLSTLAGHGLWYYLLRKHPVTKVTPYSLLVPVIGAALGLIIFEEMITWHVWLGGAITIAGVTILVIRRPKLAMIDEPV